MRCKRDALVELFIRNRRRVEGGVLQVGAGCSDSRCGMGLGWVLGYGGVQSGTSSDSEGVEAKGWMGEGEIETIGG